MAFTNIYDVTFPPDTQLANLLGQDLRNLALNVQQRMAAISGLAANLPAIGSDAQPTNWNGLLYFATDTSQIFQWSGSAWVDITSNIGLGHYKFEGSNVVPVTVANTVVLSPLQGINIPANDIGVGQTFYVDCSGVVGMTPATSLQIYLFLDGNEIDGGNPLNVGNSAANNQLWGLRLFFTGLTTGVAGTIQRPNMLWMSSPSFGGTTNNGSALGAGFTIDTTSSHTLQLKVAWGAATAANTITQNTMTCYRVG